MQNFMKTILSGVQVWTRGKIKDSTADWNQNDPNADNYVKNRTHWEEKGILLVDNLTREQYESGNLSPCNFIEGETYKVIFNGNIYDNLICHTDGQFNIIASPPSQPFQIDDDGGNSLFIEADDNWTISIYRNMVHKLDSKYLKLPSNLATIDEVQEIADSKMDAINPVGIGSFSMNNCTADGSDSTALGAGMIAIYNQELAIGRYNTAELKWKIVRKETNGIYQSSSFYVSEAYEIDKTTGQLVLVNPQKITTISQAAALPRNGIYFKQWLTSPNVYEYSNYGYSSTDSTVLNGFLYRAQITTELADCYAFVVGNGTSDTERSNAHTLDWEGNAWYSGDVYVGSTSGTNKDEGSKKLATEEYVVGRIESMDIMPEDIIEWMTEEGAITPLASTGGQLYMTNDNKILII